MKRLSSSLEKNVVELNEILGVEKSFDMIYKPLRYAGRDCAMYFVDGFVKDEILNFIMTHLATLEEGRLDHNAVDQLLKTDLPYIELETTRDRDQVISSVLSGPLVLLIDGESEAIVIDTRTYPARGPEEPDLERVVRGSRDGFVETMIFNIALTRRRVRDPSLRIEYIQIGKRSKTDICLSYIADIADRGIVEEYLFERVWNPYPMVRFTERPDVAAVHLLEGHVMIYVDTSPSVMITPTTFFHQVQHAEEYRQKPAVGLFLRWVRFIAIFSSLFLLPLWYLFMLQPNSFPDWMQFLEPENQAQVPLLVQILLVELGVEILRMASIHTPTSLATAMGLIAGFVLGETAVNIGLFTDEVILYVALSVIGTFATPSYEMGLANKIFRLVLLMITALFGWIGFMLGIIGWLFFLGRIKNLHIPYLWPLFPFQGRAFLDVLIRTPMPFKTRRIEILDPEDPDVQ